MSEILKLVGVDNSDEVTLICGYCKNGMPQFLLDGNISLIKYLDYQEFNVNSMMIGGKKSMDIQLKNYDLVFNTICDPDLNSKSLDKALKLVKTLKSTPVVNHPEHVLKTTRENIYDLYKDIKGVIAPKTIRVSPKRLLDIENIIDNKKIDLPLIFRPAGGQAGIGMVLIKSKKDLSKLEQFAFDGRDYYMIEYVDFISADRLYRKYRYFVIEGKTYPGHLIISDDWDIHRDSKYHKKSQKSYSKIEKEERGFLKKWDKSISHVFKIFHETLQLEYFGIDCGIDKKGNIVIFEINSCMDIFSPEKDESYYNEKYQKTIKEALINMFISKINTKKDSIT